MDNVFATQLARLQREFQVARLSMRIGTRPPNDVYVVCVNLQKAVGCLQKISSLETKEEEVPRQITEFDRFVTTAIKLVTESAKQLNSPFNASGTIGSCAKNIAWLMDELIKSKTNVTKNEEVFRLSSTMLSELMQVTQRK